MIFCFECNSVAFNFMECNSIECIKIIPSCCLKCGENTKNIILQAPRAINGGVIILSKCVVCGDKKSKFIKKQEAKGLSNNLVIRTL